MALSEKGRLPEIIRGHEAWCESMNERWTRIDAAVESRFWQEKLHSKLLPTHSAELTGRVFIEVNIVRPWISAFLAGLSPQGLSSSVGQPLVESGRRLPPEKPECVATVFDEFFARRDIEQVTDVALATGLTYDGGGGFYLARQTKKERTRLGLKAEPHLMPWVESIPPWDLLYDREVSCPENLPYIGRYVWMTVDDFKERFPDEKNPERFAGSKSLRPTEWQRTAAEDDTAGRESWIHLLELWDLEDVYETKGRGDSKVLSKGTIRWFALDAKHAGSQTTGPVKQLERLPVPYRWDDGEPFVQLIPIALDYTASRPLQNIAPAWAVYELAAEYNVIASILATQNRRDAGRIALYKKDSQVGDAVITAWRSGDDLALVPVEGVTGSLKDLVHIIEIPPTSDTLLKLRQLLESAINKVQMTAGFTRGQPVKDGTPASASEIDALVTASETQVGRVRNRINAALSKLCGGYLRVLLDAMEETGTKSISVYSQASRKPVRLTRADLDRRWRITLEDSLANPVTATKQKGEFLQVLKPILDLAAMASQASAHPEAKQVARLAQELLDRAVELYDLPVDMQWASLGGADTPAEEADEVAPGADQPPDALPPGVPTPAQLEGAVQ